MYIDGGVLRVIIPRLNRALAELVYTLVYFVLSKHKSGEIFCILICHDPGRSQGFDVGIVMLLYI